MFGKQFGLGDLAQQVLGGVFIAGPFVVTEEVWVLADGIGVTQFLVAVAVVLSIGYFTLYGADEGRDPDTESRTLGIPHRFLSAISVAYLSVVLLVFVFGAATTFGTGYAHTAKAVQLATIFSTIGATTADSLL